VIIKIGRCFARFIPVILVMGIIFFLSHQQGDDVRLPRVPGIDKLVHALAYGVLAGTAIFAFPPATRRRRTLPVGLAVIAFCILHGMADEFHQSFIPGRSASAGDLIADSIGSVLAVYAWSRFSESVNLEPSRVDPDFRN
jgi:VanZ family protein